VAAARIGAMRASRLLSILLLLQAKGRLTAQQLADLLEVSVRTVYRDMESLHAAGVPIYGSAGPSGGFQLVDGYRTMLTGLTEQEAESLFLTGLPGPAAELGFGDVVGATELKLTAALPARLRDRASRIRQRFHLDAPSWYRESEVPRFLPAVAGALWEQRVLHVRYRRWKAPEEVDRTLEPYGLVLKAGQWYLVAQCTDRVNVYRVSEILDLRVSDQYFTWPDGFDLAAYWRAHLAEFDRRRYRAEAVVRLAPAAMTRIVHLLDRAASRAIEQTAGPPDEAGWIEATVPIESVEHALGELLRFGPQVEVLAPPALRVRFTQTARQLAEIYGSPG